MKTLKIEHVAPYLPYDLRAIITYRPEKGTLLIEKLSKRRVWLSNGGSVHLWQEQYIDKIKPVLRPLSLLSKEIEHNGETFVPCEQFSYDIECMLREGDIDTGCQPYSVTQKLIEWHFDVFGLIEQNLSIDINTLENDISLDEI